MTCAPCSGASSRPRVRFACSTPKPPLPSASSRACTFTSTSSWSATGPVNRGYAMQGTPSTSRRTSPSTRSTIAVTIPRLSVSGIDDRERDLDHRLEVVHGDVLVGRVDLRHPVGEVEALQAALVEDVRVGRAAGRLETDVVTGALERTQRELDDGIVSPEAVARVVGRDLRLEVALGEARRERRRLEHLLEHVRDLAVVQRANLRLECAPLR